MRARTLAPLFGLAVVSVLSIPGLACLWDYDTLKMERERFPEVLEIIVGKFLRHTPEMYQWRIKDRIEKLKKEPERLEWYDDLAVAYDKVGQTDKAIETILQKDKIKPGLYETEANLSVFLVHAGKWDEGLAHVKKALQINPNAHFGREKYQRVLMEYAISRMDKDGKLPLPMSAKNHDFYEFLSKQLGFEERGSEADIAAAITGVKGMLRFANHRSPVLMEALGSLLVRGDFDSRDAKMLAARAYLMASYETKDEVSKAYRQKALSALSMQTVDGSHDEDKVMKSVEESLRRELADADAWYAGVRKDEIAWIQESGDVDSKFSTKYYSMSPEALKASVASVSASLSSAESATPSAVPPSPDRAWLQRNAQVLAILGILLASSLLVVVILKRARSATTTVRFKRR